MLRTSAPWQEPCPAPVLHPGDKWDNPSWLPQPWRTQLPSKSWDGSSRGLVQAGDMAGRKQVRDGSWSCQGDSGTQERRGQQGLGHKHRHPGKGLNPTRGTQTPSLPAKGATVPSSPLRARMTSPEVTTPAGNVFLGAAGSRPPHAAAAHPGGPAPPLPNRDRTHLHNPMHRPLAGRTATSACPASQLPAPASAGG